MVQQICLNIYTCIIHVHMHMNMYTSNLVPGAREGSGNETNIHLLNVAVQQLTYIQEFGC